MIRGRIKHPRKNPNSSFHARNIYKAKEERTLKSSHLTTAVKILKKSIYRAASAARANDRCPIPRDPPGKKRTGCTRRSERRRVLSRLSSIYRVGAIRYHRRRHEVVIARLCSTLMQQCERGRNATHARRGPVPRERRTMYPRGSAGYRGTLHDESVFGTTWSLG